MIIYQFWKQKKFGWAKKKKFRKIFRFFSKIFLIFHFIEKTTKIVHRVARNNSTSCLKPTDPIATCRKKFGWAKKNFEKFSDFFQKFL